MYNRSIFILLLGVCLLMAGCSGAENVKEVKYEGNLIAISGEDFLEGEMGDIKLDGNQLVLEDNSLSGKYISPVINTDEFNELVASWNVDTPKNTEMELLVKAKIEGEWTDWFSYGKWSVEGFRGSVRNQSEKTAKMSIDVLEILWGKDATSLQYSIDLTRDSGDISSPRVRNIFLTLKTKGGAREVVALERDYLIELDVPERSQMIIPKIGNVICSPTSLAMVLEYYGHDIDTEEVAAKVLDQEVNIYGNWSYNIAYGASKLDYAYVARFNSIDDIRDMISQGIPVVASIKTATENILVGAPQAYPAGHLLVVRGFTEKDGEEYVIVNDPAAPEVETVRREYKVSGFERAWNGMVYILKDQGD